jgi:hypothetical protein
VTLLDLLAPCLPPLLGALAALGARRALAADAPPATSLARVAVRLGALHLTLDWSTTP